MLVQMIFLSQFGDPLPTARRNQCDKRFEEKQQENVLMRAGLFGGGWPVGMCGH